MIHLHSTTVLHFLISKKTATSLYPRRLRVEIDNVQIETITAISVYSLHCICKGNGVSESTTSYFPPWRHVGKPALRHYATSLKKTVVSLRFQLLQHPSRNRKHMLPTSYIWRFRSRPPPYSHR